MSAKDPIKPLDEESMGIEPDRVKRLADEAGTVEKRTRAMPKEIEHKVEELKKPRGPVEKAMRNLEKLKEIGTRRNKSGRA